MQKSLRDTIRHATGAIHKIPHTVMVKLTIGSHIAYYGLVAIEAHGNYKYAAFLCGIFICIEALSGKGVPPA
jgi:hypothetical protein